MLHRCRENKGFTLVELLVVIGIIALLAAILLPVLAQATHAARSARCRSREGQLFKGARLYLNNYDEFFPVAWHTGTGGGSVESVSFNRFLIHAAIDTNIEYGTAAGNATKAAQLFTNTVNFWSDPATGLTNYYFAPVAVFKVPSDLTGPYRDHTQYTELTAKIPSTAMPMLTEVYAAVKPADPDTQTPAETQSGFPNGAGLTSGFVTEGAVLDAFWGVGRSFSTSWVPAAVGSPPGTHGTGTGEVRFDYRHNGGINVIFLDGHVDTIKKSHGERIEKLHDNWNTRTTNAP
ncbi:prepilin-type N-terminal cleavage/methylation domain-containing protein [bacterium]|nr:prepilin-type N-terminal cleavage/methylation domain-containing protein [bacterium]